MYKHAHVDLLSHTRTRSHTQGTYAQVHTNILSPPRARTLVERRVWEAPLPDGSTVGDGCNWARAEKGPVKGESGLATALLPK